MVKLPKHNWSEQNIIREFVPRDKETALSAGVIVVRANNYGSSLKKFDELFDAMSADMLTFEPPIELDREDVEIVKYGGRRYSGTYGLEVSIPEGHVVPAEYTRTSQIELTR